MNLDEFRKAMESDATVENERLKRDLVDAEKRYRDMSEGYTDRIQWLNSDCRALANRCFVLTHGTMCVFCELNDSHGLGGSHQRDAEPYELLGEE